MQFTPSQQDALNIEKHVCVTAGAGSGKTAVLVERYLEILRNGKASPQNIVAITFTEKAAAEMKERVIERLNKAENITDRETLLDQMSSAYISTIHAFCSRILREFPFQAKVPANFSVLQGIDQKLLLQDTLKKTLKNIATNPDDRHRPELARLLRRYGAEKKLVEIFATMIDKRDIVAKLQQKIYNDRNSTEIRTDLAQRVLEKSMSALDVSEFIRCLNTVSQVASGKNVESVEDLNQQLEAQYAKDPNSPEVPRLLKQFIDLITTKSGAIAKTAFIGRSTDTTSIETEINFLVTTVKKIKILPDLENGIESDNTGDAETDNGNQDKTDTIETDDDFLLSTIGDLLTLYTRVLNDYDTVKLAQGMLDFNDLQLKTRDLLRDNKIIRDEFVKRYKYYMVDEYQDTNELQYELVMLLTSELKSANLFIVGDPKQSIYGFRDADVRVFDKTEQKIIGEGGKRISLTENFRSLRDVIGFVNYFFGSLMGPGNENEFEVEYEALTQARHAETNGAIEILIGQGGDASVNESELIAQHIRNMVSNEKDTVWGRGGERPIQYGDIAILIRSRTHLPDIENALLEAGIPYLTTGGIGFYQRQEIYDIWNYLNFLSNPSENDASVAAVLRGPAFGISDTELYEISLEKKKKEKQTEEKQEKKSFWEKTLDYQGCTDQLRQAIDILKTHIEFAHRMPVNRLIGTIVNETGLIGTLKTGKYGQQRWENYQKLLDLARNFDDDENRQILPDFIEFLNILITEEPREGQAPIEASSGAVQIMTIHAAKGQQFPVVMLPRLDRQGQTDREPFIDEEFGIGFSPLHPDNGYQKTEPEIVDFMKNRAKEKNVAEKKRLFYVGATRAEDRLILSGTLPDSGKPQQMLEWLYTHLEIGEEKELNLDVKQEVYKNSSPIGQRFQLQIPISWDLAESADTDAETSDEAIPVAFPEDLPLALQPTEIPAAFSVSELANYARCPLRYQLENVLRIPSIKQAEPDSDEDEMDAAIRSVLRQIRGTSDTQDLDTLIQQAFENFPEIADAETELRKHINSFLDSELGQTALRASETETNQHIYADVDGHILDGRIDRLFRDETGHRQTIIYETGDAQHPTVCSPEMELYSLLIHRCYPEQPTVKINIFFTEHGQCEKGHFNAAELEEATGRWRKKISALQQGIYKKNLKHCGFCPYADADDQCIVTDPQGESP